MFARQAAAVAVSLLLASLVVVASAASPTALREVPPDAFQSVALPPVRPSPDAMGADRQPLGDPLPPPLPAVSGQPDADDPGRPRAVGAIQPVIRPTPRPTARPSATGKHRVTGVPTYYCRAGVSRCTKGYPDGPGADFYAAAGPSLRVGSWRGRVVSVTANGKTIRVKLIDWCACGGDHFLDLYWDAFKALGRPMTATVRW